MIGVTLGKQARNSTVVRFTKCIYFGGDSCMFDAIRFKNIRRKKLGYALKVTDLIFTETMPWRSPGSAKWNRPTRLPSVPGDEGTIGLKLRKIILILMN